MKPHFIVLSNTDYGQEICISRSTDLLDQAEADCRAQDFVEDTGEPAYVYKLVSEYVPENTKEVERVVVASLLPASTAFKGDAFPMGWEDHVWNGHRYIPRSDSDPQK